MTEAQILAVIERKKERHPELRRPLTWTGFRRICAREEVAIVVTTLCRREAQLVQYDGAWGILLDSNASSRRFTYYGVHELGHLWLHHDPTAHRFDRVYNRDWLEAHDSREGDAELFAVYVLGGRRFRRTF